MKIVFSIQMERTGGLKILSSAHFQVLVLMLEKAICTSWQEDWVLNRFGLQGFVCSATENAKQKQRKKDCNHKSSIYCFIDFQVNSQHAVEMQIASIFSSQERT
jgi:hypothetical protein